MIKINLLGVAPPPYKGPSVSGPPAPKATQVVIFVGVLIIAFGIVGIIYKVMTNQIADLESKRSKEILRKQELAVVKTQNERYQQTLRDLETRIDTIQALQNSRVGPVELMSSLGNIINKTNDVYLYTLTPAGSSFQLRGQSGTVNSMASFLGYLQNSGTFENVQLDQFYQDDKNERLAYKFTVSCQFKSPTAGVSPTAGGTPAAPVGPAPAPAGKPGPSAGPPPPVQAPRRAM